jgi:hypothetical protein
MLEPDLNRRVFAFEILVNTWSTFAEAPIEGPADGRVLPFSRSMEIPTRKQLPCLFAGMARCWSPAAASRAPGFIGATVVGRDQDGAAQSGQQRGNILDPLGDQMGDRAIALDPAGHAHEPPGDHRLAKGLVDLLPDHDIGCAGLVLQSEENDARRRAGALPGDDKAGDCDAATGLWQAIMGQAFGQARVATAPSDGRED